MNTIKKINLDEKRIIELYTKENKSAIKIAKIMGYSTGTILRRLKENNISLKPYTKGSEELKRIDLDEDEMIRLYVKEKKSLCEISKILNASHKTISRRLRNNNILVMHPRLDTKENTEKIINLYVNKNKPASKIAEIFETCTSTITRVLKNNNIYIKGNKHSDLDKQQIIKMYTTGNKAIKNIAKILNVSVKVINRILRENDIEIKRKIYYRKGNPFLVSEINGYKVINLYKEGESVSSIARLMDVSPSVVVDRLKKKNISIKSCSFWNKKRKRLNLDESKIIESYVEKNKSAREIARELKVDHRVITRRLKEHNIDIEPKRNVAWNKGLTKEDERFKNMYSHLIRKKLWLHPNTKKTRFKKGLKPWNKGKKGIDIYSEETRNKMGSSMKGKKHSESTKQKLSKLSIALWSNPEYRKKISDKLHMRPNYPEKRMINILNNNFIGWEYTGDFSFFIGRKNPDFVNKELKRTIDIFGKYWHKEEEVQTRSAYFKERGWDSMIIWAGEMRKGRYFDEEKTIWRVEEWLMS